MERIKIFINMEIIKIFIYMTYNKKFISLYIYIVLKSYKKIW